MKNGVCTNQWTSDWKGKEHYEPEFGKPGEYEIIEEDMTAEIAAKAAKEDSIKQAGEFLKGLKKSDLSDLDKCASAIMKIIKHLRADV
jgi:hypothetical protein